MRNPNEYHAHANLVRELGNDYSEREFRAFEVDKRNAKILSFLLYYLKSATN